jgi:pyruvate/2-oxoglutarate dehydrogenase complex dihydrolipoamide acyltransferase (E2) component
MSFEIEPDNRYFQANRGIVEHEIRPGHTVTFISEVDLTAVEGLRSRERLAGRPAPSYTAFVIKAVAAAIQAFPFANRRVCRRWWLPLSKPRLQRFEACDIAVAVERDVPGAESVAFVDVARRADAASLDDLTGWLRDLATCDVATNRQWRQFSGLISRLPHWLSKMIIRLPLFSPRLWEQFRGGAVLVSSPAKYGIDTVAASWSWPLGVSFGLVKERPVVVDGRVVARPTFNLILNFDRRIMAGAPAARFFKRMVDAIEHADAEFVGGAADLTGGPPIQHASIAC